MLCFLMLFARAEESLPQDVLVSEEIPLFVDVGLDSGWVPNSGNLAVRLELVANGNVFLEEDGTADLEWPTGLNLSINGEENGGFLSLDTILSTIVSIRFDIAGYQYEAPISTFDIPFSNSLIFDSFSLGDELQLEASSDNNIVDMSTTVLFVVDVAFYGIVRPNVDLTVLPVQWDVEGEVLDTEPAQVLFEPELGAASWDGQAKLLAEIDASLNVDFVPTFEVCVPVFGCTQWETTQIPLSSNTDAFIHESDAVALSFPLPSMSISQEEIDFGVLGEGQLSNYEFGLENIGSLLLSGQASIISGSEYFGVYPDFFLADQNREDGMMVSFLGGPEGSYEGVLEIISNDPAQTSIQISLLAEVVAEEEEEETVGGKEVDGQMVGGCGCASQNPEPFTLLAFFPLLTFFRRKR